MSFIEKEIETETDPSQIASAVVPESLDPAAEEWAGYARTLVEAGLRRGGFLRMALKKSRRA